MRGKAIVILSGGPDSSTVAYWAKREGYEVHALTFDYGQRASRAEIDSAKRISERLGIPLKVVDLSALKGVYAGATALCDEGMPMPSSFEPSLIVPFRNGVMLSIAVAYAASIGADVVLYGAQGSDAPFYPDCRREFFKAFERAARLGTGADIRIEAPFHGMRKSEVIKLGAELGVPYGLTWSCYSGGERHCGKCESCLNRKRAFEEAGLEDPVAYES
jgi:7-cyano-7-deazaguanine synthase